MKKLICLMLVFACSIMISSIANAEVRSKPCPFSCRTEGIDKAYCKDWRNGDTCYVEKLDVNKNYKGKKIISGKCPLSCKTKNISKDKCKDWRNGDTCYIEIAG